MCIWTLFSQRYAFSHSSIDGVLVFTFVNKMLKMIFFEFTQVVKSFKQCGMTFLQFSMKSVYE